MFIYNVHDKITSTASVHFLVYFVAVPGEKMIIIHSINHVTSLFSCDNDEFLRTYRLCS